VFAIRLPPLRERREDILPLAEAFLAEFAEHFGRPPAGFSDAAKRMLLEHSWPGNVRELRNSLERAAILCEGGPITPEHLAFPKSRALAPSSGPGSESVSVSETSRERRSPGPPASSGDLESSERAIIAQALERSRFNKSKAAKALGLTRHQLYVRLRRYGLE
jgi:DNA-binding NtrC family response regulator